MIMKTRNGYEFEIDECDYDLVSMYSWRLEASSTLYSTILGKNVILSRLLMGFPIGFDVDHIDRNRLNNKRSNLRVCTRQQNSWNKGKKVSKQTSSKYIGVCRHQKIYWQSYIKIDGKVVGLGYFKDEKDAARAYNEACVKERGKWAVLNDIE